MSWGIELMPVGLYPPDRKTIFPVSGIQLASTNAGIKENDRDDLVLIALAEGTRTGVVFTQNAFCAAPVILAKQHRQKMSPRYLLINSGNANAGTGEQGVQVAQQCCEAVATLSAVAATTVLPFSTGVIGQPLPLDKIVQVLPDTHHNLADDGWYDAAHAIMTTDTVAKLRSRKIALSDKTITVTGMAKGSGMIRPDMATMLAYIATDAVISQPVLDAILNDAVEQSFNRITVDGDTSTNDACVLMATGAAENKEISSVDSAEAQIISAAICEIMQFLAQAIVRDGEGASKFVTVIVEQGATSAECRQVAYTIAHSPLVKTALFASDPNWGRILAAVGRSGINNFDLNEISIYLDDVCIIKAGEAAASYTEELGQQVMNKDEITIKVELGRGLETDTVWTCDFSYDYVRINAEYRT